MRSSLFAWAARLGSSRVDAAVTLEGTIIHRSGLITGGTSARDGQGRQFEEREVDGASSLSLRDATKTDVRCSGEGACD